MQIRAVSYANYSAAVMMITGAGRPVQVAGGGELVALSSNLSRPWTRLMTRNWKTHLSTFNTAPLVFPGRLLVRLHPPPPAAEEE